jgi:hypothetical protein
MLGLFFFTIPNPNLDKREAASLFLAFFADFCMRCLSHTEFNLSRKNPENRFI